MGLVTHLLAGEGEAESDARLGAIADNLHITGVITPGVVAAKLLADKDYVIGKSMAMRRADLDGAGRLRVGQERAGRGLRARARDRPGARASASCWGARS